MIRGSWTRIAEIKKGEKPRLARRVQQGYDTAPMTMPTRGKKAMTYRISSSFHLPPGMGIFEYMEKAAANDLSILSDPFLC
jgi:hypothetical protein